MAKIDKSIDVNAPREQVFDVLTDLDLLPAWSTTTVEATGTSGQPMQQGDTFGQTLRILGKNLESSWRVTELDRPRRLAYSADAPGGGTLRMVQVLEDIPDGTRVSVDLDYQLPGGFLGKLLDTVYAERRNERELEHSLSNLKELIEARASR